LWFDKLKRMADPLTPHAHSNNTIPPDSDTRLTLVFADASKKMVTLESLKQDYPVTRYSYTYVTDHGVHGPYILTGVTLLDLLVEAPDDWSELEVLSADGFGNRLLRSELLDTEKPAMLYYRSDARMLTRQNGLVRLVVPSETDNALRQVKWVREIRVKV